MFFDGSPPAKVLNTFGLMSEADQMRLLNFFGVVLIVMGLSALVSPAFGMYNGAPANSIPGVSEETLYKSLAVVVVNQNDGSVMTCMGVLIHRNFVSTAGHCLANAHAIQIHLFSGVNTRNPVNRVGADWLIHSKWSGKQAASDKDPYSYHDVGIVLIRAAPIWNEPIQLASEYDITTDKSPKPLYLVSREIADYQSALPVLRVMELYNFVHYSAKSSVSPLYGAWIRQPDDGAKYGVCHGDSGAPVIVVDGDGTLLLVGNHNTKGGDHFSKILNGQQIDCSPFEGHYNMTFDLAFIQEAMNVMKTRNNNIVISSAN